MLISFTIYIQKQCLRLCLYTIKEEFNLNLFLFKYNSIEYVVEIIKMSPWETKQLSEDSVYIREVAHAETPSIFPADTHRWLQKIQSLPMDMLRRLPLPEKLSPSLLTPISCYIHCILVTPHQPKVFLYIRNVIQS